MSISRAKGIIQMCFPATTADGVSTHSGSSPTQCEAVVQSHHENIHIYHISNLRTMSRIDVRMDLKGNRAGLHGPACLAQERKSLPSLWKQ